MRKSVFEYRVDDTVYMAELEIMSPNNRFDLDEVEYEAKPSLRKMVRLTDSD